MSDCHNVGVSHIVMNAGVCGFSMGGVHAGMVAGLYPQPLACVPLLAPRSAAVAFCHGALRDATAWQPLVAAADEADKVCGEACKVYCTEKGRLDIFSVWQPLVTAVDEAESMPRSLEDPSRDLTAVRSTFSVADEADKICADV
jgi:pimeloyl-ACP methyl ester carboxylesterase